MISVAGDFNRDEVLLALQDLPEPAPQDLGVTAPAWTTEKALENTVEGRNQDLTLLIFPTVSLYHEDAPALEILSTALDGFNGILYQELREKRNLGYSAFPLLSQSEHTGFLAYGIIAAPEHKQTIQRCKKMALIKPPLTVQKQVYKWNLSMASKRQKHGLLLLQMLCFLEENPITARNIWKKCSRSAWMMLMLA